MALKKGQEIEVRIAEMTFGGKGLVRVEGLVVFVDQTVPQDLVKARIIKKKRNHAQAAVLSIVEPSPFRVAPPCPYSGICGGCKWQFVDYGKQLEYKRRHVADSIEHIGLIQGVPVHPTLSSEKVFGYRNKMEFSCSDRRWLLPHEMGCENVDAGPALGLHVPGTFYKVLDIDRCLLQPELGNTLLKEIKGHIRRSPMPVYGLRSHEGFWRFVMLRHSVVHDHWMVNIVTSARADDITKPLADTLMEKYSQVVSVVNNVTSRKAGIAVGEVEVPLAGRTCLTEQIGDYEFEISANSFFQTNTRGAARLNQVVEAFARLSGTETVVDLYSGTGTLAICLSKAAKAVVGIEIIESAVADARKNCRKNGIDNCRFITGDIRKSLPQISMRPEVLIIDPPRSGMHPDVVQQVLSMEPGRIVYVSCNPATLARDLGILKGAYRVAEVQPLDMFPHTYHIESVARLEKLNSRYISQD